MHPPRAEIAAVRHTPHIPPFPKKGVSLDLLVTDELPAPGYPVRCGIPFPGGMLRDVKRIVLLDRRGQPVPCAVRGTSHWQDGSIRWVLCEFVAARKQRYRLALASRPRVPAQPVKVKSGHGIRVTNGMVTLDFGKAGQSFVIAKASRRDGIACDGMHFTIKLNRVGWREEFISRVRSVNIEHPGPICAVVRVDGEMLSEEKRRFGPFRARFEIWAGLPYVMGQWRVINESDQSMAMLLDWSARLALPDLSNAIVDFGPFRRGYDRDDPSVKAFEHFGDVANPRHLPLSKGAELSCRQERADFAQVLRDIAWVATAKQVGSPTLTIHPAGWLPPCDGFQRSFPKDWWYAPLC